MAIGREPALNKSRVAIATENHCKNSGTNHSNDPARALTNFGPCSGRWEEREQLCWSSMGCQEPKFSNHQSAAARGGHNEKAKPNL